MPLAGVGVVGVVVGVVMAVVGGGGSAVVLVVCCDQTSTVVVRSSGPTATLSSKVGLALMGLEEEEDDTLPVPIRIFS